jgi:choline dehydrogenase
LEEFDYIVVGAGSAGCVLASRLTEDPATRVLLLEAGPRDTHLWIHVPLGYGKLFTKSEVNWGYESEPEPNLGGRRIFTPRGKVLGGSSSINGLVYMRGQREDYDGWGIPGWDFDALLPYFRKSENQCRGADDWHGAGGPLEVGDLERHELCDAFIDSAAALGIPRNRDFNGASMEGTGYYQATVRRGRRSSAATAYLRRAEKRPNLKVLVNTLATRIDFDGRRAIGVSAAERRWKARREVILSGGTFNSPQLLQLSGIGPGALLQKLGIAVLADLPVGEALQDHFYARTFWRCCKPLTVNDEMASLWRQARMGLRYLLFSTGPLGVAAGYAAAFVRTRPEIKRPDAQIYFINFSSARRGGVLHTFSGFTCSVSQMQVESRGSVQASSRDAREAPAIRYNYLATENDRRVMVDGLKIARRIPMTEPLRDYVVCEELPGERVQSDDELLAFVRENGETVFHPTSTCSMGKVVDAELRVKGMQGLRVIDASVMPSVPSGNINATVIAMAEKGAELVCGKA